ncbi:MAG: hypothetical protein AB1489_24160 [Acidobacteriota bacterium]
MPGGKLNIDRYHAVMGSFSLNADFASLGEGQLATTEACFYVTQRKLRVAPCVGHDRLVQSLNHQALDAPRLRYLREDRARLTHLADHLQGIHNLGLVRAVAPATIVFSGEPFADITGPFCDVQLREVDFEHAFDDPMTIASRALTIKRAAGKVFVSDFSLRRDGATDRAVDVAKYAFISGFDDTSNMEAAFQFDIPSIGTMAHYLVMAFIEYLDNPEIDSATGKAKHFEQTAFERWLDAHPKGTICLIDTVNARHGLIHAIRAAQSSPIRREAFKGVRIDSGNLIEHGWWCRRVLDANGFQDVGLILTSDLDTESIREIVATQLPVQGFGVGTKLGGEIERIAGVIFKLCTIGGRPTLKCSETKGKETLPGKLQVWRYRDKNDNYLGDVIAGADESSEEAVEALRGILGNSMPVQAQPLLKDFWLRGQYDRIPSVAEQRDFVQTQLTHFLDLDAYPVVISLRLAELKEELRARMYADEIGTQGVLLPSGCELND